MTNDLSLFKNTVHEVRARVESPIDMCFASALFAMCAATDALINVEHPTGEVSCVSLFMMTIAQSGERKSSTEKKFTQFLVDFESKIQEDERRKFAGNESISIDTQTKVWKSVERKILRDLDKCGLDDTLTRHGLIEKLEQHKSHKPQNIEKKILIDDTTSEALLHNLAHGNKNMCISTDEGGIVLEKRSAKDIAHFNRLWDGSNTSIHRVSKPSYSVVDARLSISIMVQQEYFLRFARRADGIARASGFFARNLIFNPISTQGTRFGSSSPVSNIWLKEFGKRMEELLNERHKQTIRTILTFTPEARKVWADFYHQVEESLAQNGYCSDIKDFASKITNNMCRIAAIVHYFCKRNDSIDYESATFSRDLCIIMIDNFKDIFGDGSEGQINEYRAYELHKWLYKEFRRDNLTIGILKSHILQFGPSDTRKVAKLDAALQLLHQRGIVNILNSQGEKKLLVQLNRHGFNLLEPIEPRRNMDARWLNLLRV
ncbi:YfjI family protein [Comamonas sp.]|uniref:YfjI family protein n=1 Tax=Comamonas sp. TaxID=34028 RepID=UPI0028983820|nr:YfjI family protein [Comamonas sp.]